jgi:uncharacterized protein DUF6265
MLAAVLLTVSFVASAQDRPAVQIGQVAWIGGCWQLSRGGEVIDEQWMAPRAGVMLGMARTVRGDRVASQEFTVIRVRDGRLVYEANPSGQSPATFTATAVSPDRVVFENPAHDYPKRITYARQASDALTASVDDGKGGKRIEYPYKRAICP